MEVFIISCVRTPIGNFNGSLSKVKASDLGCAVIKETLKRANIPASSVDEVIMGQVLTAGQGQNPARQAALSAGLPLEVAAFNVNMLCGSGLKAVALGYQSIRNGDNKIVICGGQENMSIAPHVLNLRQNTRMGPAVMLDTLMTDGLIDAMNNIHMGITAENLAKKYNISRQSQDEYATLSQNRAENAQQNDYFKTEIVPIEVTGRKNENITIDRDEYIKPGTTVEGLEKLKSCFITNGTVTAGNSSGINDAAAAVLLMSGEEVERNNIKPLAKIVSWAQTGVDPQFMGIGPVSAIEAVLKKANWTKDDVDLYELNEAFAAQSLAVLKLLSIDSTKVNIYGGSIALGHPIGASGARILVTLLNALKRNNGRKGIASLCIGGGMGIALAVERIED